MKKVEASASANDERRVAPASPSMTTIFRFVLALSGALSTPHIYSDELGGSVRVVLLGLERASAPAQGHPVRGGYPERLRRVLGRHLAQRERGERKSTGGSFGVVGGRVSVLGGEFPLGSFRRIMGRRAEGVFAAIRRRPVS